MVLNAAIMNHKYDHLLKKIAGILGHKWAWFMMYIVRWVSLATNFFNQGSHYK